MEIKFISKDTKIKQTNKLLRKAMYSVHQGQCFYTGRFVDFEDIHIDHISPKAKGGSDCIDNYVLTCGVINHRKNAKYSDVLIALTTELNNLLFVNDIVIEYNNLLLNQNILDTMIDINTFLKCKGYGDHPKRNSFTQFVLRRLTVFRKYKQSKKGGISPKKNLFFDKNKLESSFNLYDWDCSLTGNRNRRL